MLKNKGSGSKEAFDSTEESPFDRIPNDLLLQKFSDLLFNDNKSDYLNFTASCKRFRQFFFTQRKDIFDNPIKKLFTYNSLVKAGLKITVNNHLFAIDRFKQVFEYVDNSFTRIQQVNVAVEKVAIAEKYVLMLGCKGTVFMRQNKMVSAATPIGTAPVTCEFVVINETQPNIVDIAACHAHSVLLNKQGEVFLYRVDNATLDKLPLTSKIIKMIAFSNVTIMLGEDKTIWVAFCGDVPSDNDRDNFSDLPHIIEGEQHQAIEGLKLYKANHKALQNNVDIFASYKSVICLRDDGRVIQFGSANPFQRTPTSYNAVSQNLTQTLLLFSQSFKKRDRAEMGPCDLADWDINIEIKKVAMNLNTVLILTQQGEVYARGKNTNHESGLGHQFHLSNWTKVPMPSDQKVQDIVMNDGKTYFHLADYSVLVTPNMGRLVFQPSNPPPDHGITNSR